MIRQRNRWKGLQTEPVVGLHIIIPSVSVCSFWCDHSFDCYFHLFPHSQWLIQLKTQPGALLALPRMLKIVDLLSGIYLQHHEGSTPRILQVAAHTYDPQLPGKTLLVFGRHCHCTARPRFLPVCSTGTSERSRWELGANADLSLAVLWESSQFTTGRAAALFFRGRAFQGPPRSDLVKSLLKLPHKLPSLDLKDDSLIKTRFLHNGILRESEAVNWMAWVSHYYKHLHVKQGDLF